MRVFGYNTRHKISQHLTPAWFVGSCSRFPAPALSALLVPSHCAALLAVLCGAPLLMSHHCYCYFVTFWCSSESSSLDLEMETVKIKGCRRFRKGVSTNPGRIDLLTNYQWKNYIDYRQLERTKTILANNLISLSYFNIRILKCRNTTNLHVKLFDGVNNIE